MKQLISVPVYGLIFGRTASLKNFTAQHGRYFHAVKTVHLEVLNSQDQKNAHTRKRFSKSPDTSLLMDFDVWLCPKFSCIPKFFYHRGVFGNSRTPFLDFVKCSEKALHVVATLLSQLRFPELEGLLTPECKEQVTKNMKSWTKSQASFLVFDPEHLSVSFPCDINLTSAEKEKLFAEVRVIYYVWLEFSEKIGRRSDAFSLDDARKSGSKLYLHAVYNCMFTKEVTEGINDQWIISRINVRGFPTGLMLK